MRLLSIILISLAALGAAHAQSNPPPLLTPVQPAPPPPMPAAPPPVPSVVTPIRTPSYGVPPNINTSTPLSSSSGRVIYRQPSGASPRDRVAKRKYYKKRHHTAN